MKKLIFASLILIATFLVKFDYVLAGSIEVDELQNNNLKESTVNTKNQNKKTAQNQMKDIFGDEQTFPFVAGLGKNAAH